MRVQLPYYFNVAALEFQTFRWNCSAGSNLVPLGYQLPLCPDTVSCTLNFKDIDCNISQKYLLCVHLFTRS